MNKGYQIKRWLSLFMVAVLVVSGLTTNVYAATGGEAEHLTFTPAAPKVVALPEARLEELSGRETVYFGATSVDLEEGDAYYSLPVYREGDLETEASISLLTLDVSALYGEDYELCLDNVFTAGKEQPLMQQSAGSGAVISNVQGQEDMQALLKQAAEERKTAEGTDAADQETDQSASESEASDDAASGAGSEVGRFSRSVLESLGFGSAFFSDEEAEQAISSQDLNYSAGCVLHFAPGEKEKTVTFHVMEDTLEEGQEMFAFVLADAEGTDITQQYTFTAVINDNEQLHKAVISFDSESYSSENGEVTVTVERSGSTYSMIDFYLISEEGSAKTGSNYTDFNETVVMQPYQTTYNYTFKVSGTGTMTVVLSPITDCTLGDIVSAEVQINEEEISSEQRYASEQKTVIDELYKASDDPESEPAYQSYSVPSPEELALYGEGKEEEYKYFNLKIGDDDNYFVKYKGTSETATVGGIYKKGYEGAAPRVGDYYFLNTGVASYSTGITHPENPTKSPVRIAEFIKADGDAKNSHAHLYWFCGRHWYEGYSNVKTKSDLKIGAVWYGALYPDWQGLHWGGCCQKYEFWCKTKGSSRLRWYEWPKSSRGAEFPRKVDTSFKISMPYFDYANKKITMQADAVDQTRWCVKVGLNVYGFVCLYKAYDIKVNSYDQKQYKTAGGTSLTSLPMRLQILAGIGHAHVGDVYKTVYADSTGEQNKITFSPSDIYLNGHSGIFGDITGYTIVYKCEKSGKESKTVTYPSDFHKFLDEKANDPAISKDDGNYIDWSKTAVQKRKEKDKSILTVNFDEYFIAWLAYLEKNTTGESKDFPNSPIKMSFTPIIEYRKAKVKVLEPKGKNGKFVSSELSVGEHEFHVGDELNLSAVASEADVVPAGYEVSYDDGANWDTYGGKTSLFISNRESDIMIRPLMTSRKNKIRFEFIGDAGKHLAIENLIDEEDLEGTEYEGMLLYDVDPDKTSMIERARPKVGSNYQINIRVMDQPLNESYVYRPVIIDQVWSSVGKISTQIYPLTARSEESDNKILIGVEQVKKSELQTYTIGGTVKMEPLRYKRDDAGGTVKEPAAGYRIFTFDAQTVVDGGGIVLNMIEGSTNNEGKYSMTGITAKEGDAIPVFVSSDFGTGQTCFIKAGASTDMKNMPITIRYPTDAPIVTSIMYSFNDNANNIKFDTNLSTVPILDDKIKYQVVVDDRGHEIEGVKLTIIQYGGAIVERQMTRKKNNSDDGEEPSNVWEFEAKKKMLDDLHPGDRMYVSITDKKTTTVWINGKEKKIPVTYPMMNTGLSFYLYSQPKVPQKYEQKLYPEDEKFDIPLLGKGSAEAGVDSGLLSWTHTAMTNEKGENTGYAVTVNICPSVSVITPLLLGYRMQQLHQENSLPEDKHKEPENLGHKMFQKSEQPFLQDLPDLKDLEEQVERNNKARENQGNDEADPQGQATEFLWSVNATTIISLYYVKNGHRYTYKAGDVVFAFSFVCDYAKLTKFNILGHPVPGYINISGFAQGGYSGTWEMDDKTVGIDLENFKTIQGDVSDAISSGTGSAESSADNKWQKNGMVTFGVTGIGGPGIGIKDIISVKGSVELGFQVGIPAPKKDGKTGEKKKTGAFLNFGGGFTLNTLIGDINIPFFRIQKGLGAFKDMTEIKWFGFISGHFPKASEIEEMQALSALRKSEVLAKDGSDIYYFVENLTGTSDMSSFGQHSDGTAFESGAESDYAYPSTLLGSAADYTRLQSLTTSEDGNRFIAFIGSRGENGSVNSAANNDDALYFATYNAASDSWSEPRLVDDDGSFDTKPVLQFDEKQKKVTVSWSSAEKPFTEGESLLSRLGKLRVKTAVYTLDESGSVSFAQEPVFLSGSKASLSDEVKKASPSDAVRKAEESVETKEETKAEEAKEEAKTETEGMDLLGAFHEGSKYADIPRGTWIMGDTLYSLFVRLDLTKVKEIQDVVDYSLTKPAMYFAEIDIQTGEVKREYDLKLTAGASALLDSDAELILVNGSKWNPLNCDATDEDAQHEKTSETDKNFLLISYMQDEDGDLEKTQNDRILKLCLVEIGATAKEPFVYPSMDVVDKSVEQVTTDSGLTEEKECGSNLYMPDITTLDDKYYLSYMKDGYQLKTVEISTYLYSLFCYDYLYDLCREKAEKEGDTLTAATKNGQKPWYELTTQELNKAWKEYYKTDETVWIEDFIEDEKNPTDLDKLYKIVDPFYTGETPIEDGAYFNPILKWSDLSALQDGKLEAEQVLFHEDTTQIAGISEYQLVSNGEDLYVIYTDAPTNRNAPEQELFCVKLEQRAKDSSEGSKTAYSIPVQLTNAQRVLTDINASMDKDGNILVISEGYTQTIPEEGGIIFSESSIVETRYKTGSILRISGEKQALPQFDGWEGGSDVIQISYDVKNNGLEPQAGYVTWVENDGSEVFRKELREKEETDTVVPDSGEKEATDTEEKTYYLVSGQTDSFTFNWKVDNYGVNEKLDFYVADLDGNVLNHSEFTIEEKKTLAVAGAEAYLTAEGIKTDIQVKNEGNVGTDATVVKVNRINSANEVEERYGMLKIPALKPGQTAEATLTFIPEVEDFTASGTIDLSIELPEDTEGHGYPIYYVAGDPQMLVIADGKDTLYVQQGSSRKVEATAVPLAEEVTDIVYSVEDPSIAYVTEDGRLVGCKVGTTTLKASNQTWALEGEVRVVVGTEGDDSGSDASDKLPSYVDRGGTWKQDANGNWTYTTKAGVKAADRWLAIAEATYGNGRGFQWFRFDKDGNMVTGWFRDTDDRMYYLQIVSDGNKGRMLTGWQKIDGDWYYFEPVSTGYKGSMYRNARTRDGYYVGDNGKWDGKDKQ